MVEPVDFSFDETKNAIAGVNANFYDNDPKDGKFFYKDG